MSQAEWDWSTASHDRLTGRGSMGKVIVLPFRQLPKQPLLLDPSWYQGVTPIFNLKGIPA